ncbi:MAG: hypothetical protein AAGA56_28115 [Myxococcota bacterium]
MTSLVHTVLERVAAEARQPLRDLGADDITFQVETILQQGGPDQVDALLERYLDRCGRAWCVSHLVPALAEGLGRCWEGDRCSFIEVTDAAMKIQRWVTCAVEGQRGPAQPVVLLATLPGEQHDLGLTIVEYQLASVGWLVERYSGCRSDLLAERAAEPDVAAVGFSVTNRNLVRTVVDHGRLVRRGAGRADLPLLLGGPADLDDAASRLHAIRARPRQAVIPLLEPLRQHRLAS